MKIKIITLFLLALVALCTASFTYAGILPATADTTIKGKSITINVSGSNPIDISREVGLKILTAFRLVVAGFALIYIVLIGAYMIVFSESEDRIKSQKKQFTYAMIGFLFLNIPGLIYTVFFGSTVP
jgi:hypothetical protein